MVFFICDNFDKNISYIQLAEIISSAASNVVSALVKWLWSLQSTPKTGTQAFHSELTFNLHPMSFYKSYILPVMIDEASPGSVIQRFLAVR